MGQGVNFTVLDNGLGLAPAGQGNVMAVIGTSSIGTAYQPYMSAVPGTFVTNSGYGPGPELAAKVANDTGNNVVFVKAPSATPGSNTAVVATRVGTPSSSTVTVTGTPFDSYDAIVTVNVGGTIGVTGIQIQVSLDNNRTIYAVANLLTANSYAIPNTGLTVNFGAGTLNAGDTFAWMSTEPLWNDAGIVSAINSLLTINTNVVDIFVPGIAASGDVPSLDSAMTNLFNKKRFSRLLCAARDVLMAGTSTETEATWVTSLVNDAANNSSLRVGMTAGHYNFVSPISQTQFRRPLLWGAGARDAAVAIQIDLGDVSKGAIPMVLPTTPDGRVYHDESVLAGLDAARYISAWSLSGLPGLYIMNPNLMAPPGSDFKWLQYGHVVDAACVIAYQFFVKRVSTAVRVDPKTGFILGQDANALETGCNRAFAAAGLVGPPGAPGAVSQIFTTVNRQVNMLSANALFVTVNIVPLAYLKKIDVTMTFLNPALVAVSNAIGGSL